VNLIILEPHEVDASGCVALSDARARHVRQVLAVHVGDRVRVGLLNGPAGLATVTSVDPAVALECEWQAPPPRPRVDLLLALPRPKVMRRLWAQLAALGIGRIILTNAERVERDYFDAHTLDASVYRPLLIEGLQQARDTWLPDVSIHRRFRPLVEDDLDGLTGDALRLVADPSAVSSVAAAIARSGASSTPASGAVPAFAGLSTRVLVAIGPEGGWNPFELALLEAHRFVAVTMGARTLRTDTACVALLALTHAALGR
jgi:RsmE family RNA methyltransferase